jgi:hypothetical protein
MYYTGTVDDLVLPKFAIYRIELGRNVEKRDECRETYEIFGSETSCTLFCEDLAIKAAEILPTFLKTEVSGQ